MSHAFTLVEETRDEVWRQLSNPPDQRFGTRTSARYVNKQLKYLLSTLFKELLESILVRMQRMLGESKKSTWTPAFAILTVLALVVESLQLLVRLREYINRIESLTPPTLDATGTILDIEERFHYLTRVFHAKYTGHGNKLWNPLYDTKTRNGLDDHDKEFVLGIYDMIEDHRMFSYCTTQEYIESSA